MSRTASRYWPSLARSPDPSWRDRSPARSVTESSRLASFRSRAFRMAGIRAPGVAEEPLEHDPRVVLHRQRRRVVRPRDGVGVGATETVVARSGEVAPVHRQLQRRELRLASEGTAGKLVHRDGGRQVGAVVGLRAHAGEEPRGRPGVRPRLVRDPVHPRQHLDVPAERLEGLEHRRKLEPGPLGGRGPVLHHHPVRDVDDPESLHRRGGRVPDGRKRRHHPVEERQRERGAQAAQHGAAWNRLSGDDHDSDLRMRNGVLCTIPTMIDDQR